MKTFNSIPLRIDPLLALFSILEYYRMLGVGSLITAPRVPSFSLSRIAMGRISPIYVASHMPPFSNIGPLRLSTLTHSIIDRAKKEVPIHMPSCGATVNSFFFFSQCLISDRPHTLTVTTHLQPIKRR